MFKWNKKEINELIKYLKSINSDLEEIQNDLELLYFLKRHFSKNKMDKLVIKENLFFENAEYEELNTYDNLIDILIAKYSNENENENENKITVPAYKPIFSKKEDILLFTLDNIYSINKKWGEVLEPYIFSKYTDFRRSNGNNTYYLGYLNKFFISLAKSNNITDFTTPTHEYLHVYHTILNNKSFKTIEAEFLSFLGELITSYEMYIKGKYCNEILKLNMDNYITFINYIKSIFVKRSTIIDEIDYRKKIQYIYNELLFYKNDIKKIYTVDLSYNYTYSISYILAIELFKIYLSDKEKCIYISENIIKSNKSFEEKIKENNIELLQNDDIFVKQLKKEYTNL